MPVIGARSPGFRETPDNELGVINGGFFSCGPSVFDYIEGDSVSCERTSLDRLAREGWQHTGLLRDRRELEELWASGKVPWRTR
jgi:glucose-1-phosphate cytidylyltransferase